MDSKPAIVFVLLLYCGLASGAEKLRLGYVEYPPVVYSDENNLPRGPLIDYLDQNLGAEFELEWSKMPIGRARWAFDNDVIDAFPFLMWAEDRVPWIHYFEKPYMTIQNIVCSLKDIGAPAGELDSLSDLMAGSTLVSPLNVGYRYPFLGDSRISHINIPFSDYTDRSLELLQKGRADYVFYSSSAGLELGGKNKDLFCIDVGERVGLYFAFSKNNRLAPGVEGILERLETLDY